MERPPRTDFPPIRACLFDMDGLLLDTEDLYTLCINIVLERHGRPSLPWSIKAKLQGRPAAEANRLFNEWAQLPIPQAQYEAEYAALQRAHFPTARPLPGVTQLLANLGRTRYWDLIAAAKEKKNEKQEAAEATAAAARRVHIALATSSGQGNFRLKTDHLTELFSVFSTERRVLGDDARIGAGRGKPLPDIYLLALETINSSLAPGEPPVTPEECLVFEDSVPGVEAGRRAGMRVVWVPHPGLREAYTGREADVLAGRTGEAGEVDAHQLGYHGDGWAEYLPTLEDFPYQKYGMVIPPLEVEEEECMKETAGAPDEKVEVVQQ